MFREGDAFVVGTNFSSSRFLGGRPSVLNNVSSEPQIPLREDSPLKTVVSEGKRFHRGVIFSLVKYGVRLVTGFGYWFLSAHLLGAEIIGIVALLTSILGLFRPMTSFGELFSLVPALNRYNPTQLQVKRMFWIVLGISTLTTLILSFPYGVITSAILIHIYHQASLVKLLLFYMIGFYSIYNLSMMLGVPFVAYQEMKYSAFAELMSGLTRMVTLVIFVWWLGRNPVSAILSQVLGFLVAVIVLFILLPRVLPGKEGGFSRPQFKQDLKEIYHYSFKLMPGTVSISILQHADRLILGYYTSASFLGIYSLVYSLFERVLMMGTSYEDMVFSSSSRAHALAQEDILGSIYRSALRTSIFWVMPLVILLAGFADSILSLFGSEFVQGGLALAILLGGIFFDNFGRITTGMMGGVNRPGLKAIIVGLGALTNLTLNWVLIPQLGIVGAAIANSLGYVATALLCAFWLVGFSKVRFFNRRFLGQLLLLGIVNGLIFAGLILFKTWVSWGIIGFIFFSIPTVVLYYGLGHRYFLQQPV